MSKVITRNRSIKKTDLKDLLVDADGAVLGRMATTVVAHLLKGGRVNVINAERAVISGDPRATIHKYTARRAIKKKSNPAHSPHWPRRPDMLVKRIIRGMLPWYKQTGRDAFHNLRVHMGVPDNMKVDGALKPLRKKFRKSIMIKDLSQELGWHANQ